MATSSTVPTVEDQLKTKLAARAGLSGVQIEVSWPGHNTENETIFVADPLDQDSLIPVMRASRQKREESYRLDVIIQVVKPAGTVKDARDRAYTLLAELDGELADDPRIGLSGVVDWIAITGHDRVQGLTDNGAGCRLDVHLEVQARLA